jgi:5-(carboxyamino)imidazole ribonucleotide synthase
MTVVGIVGGGQLARMLAEAATPLGIHVRVLAGEADEGAAEVVPDLVVGSPDDPEALRAFAAGVDVLTFDHENVDHPTLEAIEASGVPVRPGVGTLRYSDKAHQRRHFRDAGLPVPPFEVVDPSEGLTEATDAALAFAAQHGNPAEGGRIVLKASRGGYDGRGVWMLGAEELPAFLADYTGAPLVLEPKLALRGEVAVLVARRPSGQVAVWPVVETVQVDGMCDEVYLPAPIDPEVERRAAEIGEAIAVTTGAVGVFAVELFLVDGGEGPQVLVNEIAPRVHNSGHLTIEGCATSQFEQHLRAVLDWPLGPTHATAPVAVMANVVGGPDGDPRDRQGDALAAVPHAHLHLYGKTSRPARKIGHVTVLGDDLERCRADARLAADVLAAGPTGVVQGSPDG